MIRIRDISLRPEEGETGLRREASRTLGIDEKLISELKIKKRSVDARKKRELRVVYTVDVSIDGNETSLIAAAGIEMTPQKVPSLLKGLIAEGAVIKGEVKVAGKGKHVGYALGEAEVEAAAE